jgi:hypothetical protein
MTRAFSAEAIAQYVALPAIEERRAGDTGGPLYLRCSCVGLVLYAYRDVLELLDDTQCPLVPLEMIRRIWPHIDLVDRAELGLGGQGPWAVALPGYVFHAMNREISSLPYEPAAGDERFPR